MEIAAAGVHYRKTSSRRRKAKVIAGSLVLLVAFLAVPYANKALSSGNQPQCSMTYPKGLQVESGNTSPVHIGTMQRLVFVLSPGSTLTLCVSYRISDVTNPPSNTVQFNASVYTVTSTPIANAISNHSYSGYSYSYAPAQGITTSSAPNSIPFQSSMNTTQSVTVAYTITATATASGFYAISFSNECPGFLPLAVGHPASELQPSDFPGFFEPTSCESVPPLSGGKIVGFGGAGVAWLEG